MVNYRRVCEATVLAALLALAAAAPAPDCHEKVYDQRQNGSENYRLNIDGVVIAVAPAESLLSAVSDIDLSDLFDMETLSEQGLKPKPPNTDLLFGEEHVPLKPEKPEKPLDAKPEDKPQEAQDVKPAEAPAPALTQKEQKSQKKSAAIRKQETAQRLKHRIASMFLPFLRKRRHQ